MSPIRCPSPFETSADPGDALLSSSINLEGYAESAPGPSVTSRLLKGEIILLKTEHMCPSVENGKARGRMLAGLLKRLAELGVKAVRVLAEKSLPEDDSSSVGPEGAGMGTFSFILSTKKAIFDEALSGLDSLSNSVYIKTWIDPEAGESSGESVDEVIRRVERAGLLSWDGGKGGHGDGGDGGDGGGEAGEAVHDYGGLASGFVLINVQNDLGGDGQAFLQMQEYDDGGHCGDMDVCYSGAGF
jgi:hypothetical protein